MDNTIQNSFMGVCVKYDFVDTVIHMLYLKNMTIALFCLTLKTTEFINK
jgi:hypothetical protein